MEFKLDSYYCSLRDAGKKDISVKLLLATGLGSLDAVWRTGHIEPQLTSRFTYACFKEKMFECER